MYKVRVRVEYLEQPGAMLREAAHLPRRTATVARWFDVKEHWVGLGAAWPWAAP